MLHSDWTAIPVAACTKTVRVWYPTFRQYAKVGLRPTMRGRPPPRPPRHAGFCQGGSGHAGQGGSTGGGGTGGSAAGGGGSSAAGIGKDSAAGGGGGRSGASGGSGVKGRG